MPWRVSSEEQLQLVLALRVGKIQDQVFSRPISSASVEAIPGQNRRLAAAWLPAPVAIAPPMRELPCAGRDFAAKDAARR
jgi:hypothetical protein